MFLPTEVNMSKIIGLLKGQKYKSSTDVNARCNLVWKMPFIVHKTGAGVNSTIATTLDWINSTTTLIGHESRNMNIISYAVKFPHTQEYLIYDPNQSNKELRVCHSIVLEKSI